MALHPQDSGHTVADRRRNRRIKELQDVSKELGGDRGANVEIQKLQNPEAFEDGKFKPGKRRPKKVGAIRRHFEELDKVKKEASK